MEFSRSIEAFMTLVRAGLWEKAPDCPDRLYLSTADWKEVLSLAKGQTISGLLWRGLDLAADAGLELPLTLLPSVAAAVDACERRCTHLDGVAARIFADYESQGLHPALLKGASLARLYAHPELRESGDIDIYFNAEEFPAAAPNGCHRKADGSIDFKVDGVEVELHDHILDIERPRSRRPAQRLVEEYGFDDGFRFRTTAPQLTVLLLNAHIFKHAIGRGVGLRQICDYALARTRWAGDTTDASHYDCKRYLDDVQRLGLGVWTSVLDCFCVKYLGMPGDVPAAGQANDGKTAALAERLLEQVLSGGNFGFQTRKGNGAWSTLRDFLGHLGFSLKLSGTETVWTIISLTKGRLGL